MTIDSGTKLGRYEVRSPIGAGGMGEVYLALDTELDRTVAIKILPEALATDEQRLQRFVQEAKAASALNHPHILTIYEIGTIGASRFIATEFIDGDTLRQRIDAGIKLVDILEISIQAGSALAAAHAAGIIHRDIKPENIMVRRDGYYALAYAGLSEAYGLLPSYTSVLPKDAFPQAKAAALKALAIDDTLAEAHVGLANVLTSYDWNFVEAERELRRAIELNPNYATAHQWLSDGPLLATGRFEEAHAAMKRAQELDPLSLIINAEAGTNYTYARQYDKAIEKLRKTIEMDQSFYYSHWSLGEALALKGSFAEALNEYQIALRLVDDPYVLALIGHAYAMSGKRDEALKTIEQLKEISKQRYVAAYAFAEVYAALGDKDHAFQWLEKSVQDRAPDLVFYRIDPLIDNLRSDPRYDELGRRAGLAELKK